MRCGVRIRLPWKPCTYPRMSHWSRGPSDSSGRPITLVTLPSTTRTYGSPSSSIA